LELAPNNDFIVVDEENYPISVGLTQVNARRWRHDINQSTKRWKNDKVETSYSRLWEGLVIKTLTVKQDFKEVSGNSSGR